MKFKVLGRGIVGGVCYPEREWLSGSTQMTKNGRYVISITSPDFFYFETKFWDILFYFFLLGLLFWDTISKELGK